MAGEQSSGLNHLKLTARLIAHEAIRYTPAGQPVINYQLQYIGELNEAGIPRKVEMQIAAITIGPMYRTIEAMEVGQLANFEGFLAHRSLRSQALVFHITNIHF
jgi:primosomal replication protein N